MECRHEQVDPSLGWGLSAPGARTRITPVTHRPSPRALSLYYEESDDPIKITYSIFDLFERTCSSCSGAIRCIRMYARVRYCWHTSSMSDAHKCQPMRLAVSSGGTLCRSTQIVERCLNC